MIQLIEYNREGDRILFSVHSSELKKNGWKFNNGNIPSAYLTGFLFGNKLKKENNDDIVLDIGLAPSIKGSRIYAALKGILDAGLNIPHSDSIFPNEERTRFSP